MSTKPYQLSAKCYRWGVCCPLDFETIEDAMAAVTKPQDASQWVISKFTWLPGEGPKYGGVVATLCGSTGSEWVRP
jgi:hypothetical protein